MSIQRDTPSHAPSDRLGACDPCASGDHGGCAAVVDGSTGNEDCTCYEDAWEWHEHVGSPLIIRGPAA